jgi:hypothetical protein
VPDAWGRLSFFFLCPRGMSALDPGRLWPRAPCTAFLGVTASPVDAMAQDPGRHALVAELSGQLCEVHSRPDLPEPIV